MGIRSFMELFGTKLSLLNHCTQKIKTYNNGVYLDISNIIALQMYFISATTEEILREFAVRVRANRLMQQLSQLELAHMAGLSLGAVRKLENDGQSSLETFVRVAQALGLSAELTPLFAKTPQSIAQMQRAAAVPQRQRAPRRSPAQSPWQAPREARQPAQK